MSQAFFNALEKDEKEPQQSSFFDALEKDKDIKSSTSNSFFDALDADTSLSAGSDAPPVSGSNQPSLSFDPSLIEPIRTDMTGNPMAVNQLMANEIEAGNQPQVITYEPKPVVDETLLTPAQREFERINQVMMQPGPKPNINLNPTISQVQGDFGNFRMADNAGVYANYPLSNTEALRMISEANIYQATNNALSRGVGRLNQVTNILGQQLGLKDTSQFISRMQELDRIYPDAPKEVQDALSKITEAKTYKEAFGEMIKNPSAVLSIVGESFPMMLPGLAAATGVTLATGNPILGAVTIGASSGSVEFGNVLMEELQQSGVDMNDNAALEAQLNNGEFWARARKRATARGVPIALFDALSFGIAGKLTGLARGSGIGRTSAAVATESVVLQPGLGGAGERVAQEAEKQLGFRDEINPGEVALEAVSEAPIGVIETATGIARERANQITPQQTPEAQTEVQQPTETSTDASTVDVTEQSDPTLNRDDPADLVAPTTPEQPAIPEQPEPVDVKTEAPVQPVTKENVDEPQEAAKPKATTKTRDEIIKKLDDVNTVGFRDVLREEVFDNLSGYGMQINPQQITEFDQKLSNEEQVFTRNDPESVKQQKDIVEKIDEVIQDNEKLGGKEYAPLTGALREYKEYLNDLKTTEDTTPDVPENFGSDPEVQSEIIKFVNRRNRETEFKDAGKDPRDAVAGDNLVDPELGSYIRKPNADIPDASDVVTYVDFLLDGGDPAGVPNSTLSLINRSNAKMLEGRTKQEKDTFLKRLNNELEVRKFIKNEVQKQTISQATPTKPSKPTKPKGFEAETVPVMRSETTTDVDSVVPEKSVKGIATGRVFTQRMQTLRQSTYRGAFRDAGVNPKEAANLSTGNQFRILDRTLKKKYGFTFVQPPRTGATYDNVNTMLDAYHNLQWMTHALNLPTKAIGLDGTLGLALPQRNWGGYLAAYMPKGGLPSNVRSDIDPVTGPVVIMPRRVNSFAHEWGHALDYFLMDKYGSGGSRGITGVVRSNLKNGTRPWQDGTPLSVTEAMGSVMNAMFFDKADVALKIKEAEQEVARLQAKQDKTNKPILALGKAKERLQKLIEGSTRTKVGKTDYRKQSGEFGKSQGMEDYYLRPTEMFARAFEAYVANAVEGAGGRNEFITKGDDAYQLTMEQVKGADDRLAKTYPKESDRANIFLAMDRLMEAIRTEAIQEGTVAEAPGDMDAIDAVAEFNGEMESKKAASLKNAPKAVADAIIGEQKRAAAKYKQQQQRIMSRPSEFTGETKFARKISEWQDKVGASVINTKRQILFNLSNRYKPRKDENGKLIKGNPKIRKIMEEIISKVATDPGSLDNRVTSQGGTFEEGTRQSGRRFLAVYDSLVRKHKFDEYTDAQMKQLRLILTSDEKATANADRAVIDAAGDIRTRLLNPMYDYMIQNGSEINYVQGNGYMPRMLDTLIALNDKPKFIGRNTPGRGAYNLYADVIYENEYGVYEEGSISQMKQLLSLANKLEKNEYIFDTPESVNDLRVAIKDIESTRSTIKNLEEEGSDTAKFEAKLQKQLDEAAEAHQQVYNDMRSPYAENAANDWFKRLQERQAQDPSAHGLQGDFAKKRKLPPEADSYMVDFYLNPHEAILDYIPSVVRRTEYEKRFGSHLVPEGKGKKRGLPPQAKSYLDYQLEELAINGMKEHEIHEVRTLVDMITGRHGSSDAMFVKLANGFNTFGTMALLERAVLSSVAEPITAAVQTGQVRDGLKTLAYSFDGLFTGLRGEQARKRKMYYGQLANIMGVIDLPQTGDMIANRLGGTAQEDAKNAARLSTFFLRTGLTRVTIAQRKAAMRTGMEYIVQLAKQYKTTEGAIKTEARNVLRDFGINDNMLSEFTDYAANLTRDENGLIEIKNIMEASGQLTDMGGLFSVAVNRFVDQTIQDPKIVDRPKYAETPVGRIVFGIQSFIAAFQRNVLEMTLKRARRDAKGGFKRGSVSVLGKTIAPLTALYAGHFIVSTAREALFNPDKLEEERENDNLAGYLIGLGFSRSGFFGRADVIVNAFKSVRYQADLSNVLVGATGAYYLKAVQRIWGYFSENNSENTVAAEYQAIRGMYDILIPYFGGLAATYGALSPAFGYMAGAANAYIQSPQATHWITRNIIKQMYNEEYYPGGGGRKKSDSDRVY